MIIAVGVPPTKDFETIHCMSDIGWAMVSRSSPQKSKKNIVDIGISSGTTIDILADDKMENITSFDLSCQELFEDKVRTRMNILSKKREPCILFMKVYTIKLPPWLSDKMPCFL